MKLSEDSLTPLYQQVMEMLKDAIEMGTYVAGDKIPSEAELSDLYSVSRITVRRAVQELVKDGYLTKKQGKGTFVNRRKLSRKIYQCSQTQSFTDTCAEDGRVAGAHLLGVQIVDPQPREREFLHLSDDEKLIHVKRIRTVDGIPIMLENNFYPLEGFEFLLEENLEDVSIFNLVEEHTGRRPTGDDRATIEIVRASVNEARALNVPTGEPLFLERVNFTDQQGVPFLIGKQYIVGSLYVFSI